MTYAEIRIHYVGAGVKLWHYNGKDWFPVAWGGPALRGGFASLRWETYTPVDITKLLVAYEGTIAPEVFITEVHS